MVKSTKTVYFYILEGREMIENKNIPRFELATEEMTVQLKPLENDICLSGSNGLTPRAFTPRRDKSGQTTGDDRTCAAKEGAPHCWSES